MNTETTGNCETRGWLFYDADCSHCVRLAERASRLLVRRGFRLIPLQTPGVPERVGITPEALSTRMHLLLADGRRFVGADALVEMARHFHWAKPLVLATRFPPALSLLRRGYDWIAAHRNCLGGKFCVPRRRISKRVFFELP